MATKVTTAALSPAELKALKAARDAAYHAGTRADRTVQMYENGARAAREAKGYGRIAVAQALGMSPANWWIHEFVYPAGSIENKATLELIKALPSAKKPSASPAKKETEEVL